MMRLLNAIERHATSDRLALFEIGSNTALDRSITYKELFTRAKAVAQLIEQSTSTNDTVMLAMPNGIDFCVSFVGALLSGRTLFPVQSASSEVEMKQLILKSQTKLLITNEPHSGDVQVLDLSKQTLEEQASPTAGSSPSLILQTSGTTGKPKLIVRDADSLDAVAIAVVNGLGINQQDRILAAIPLGHSYGIEHGILAPLYAGSCIYTLAETLPAATHHALIHHRITVFPSVPVLLDLMGRSTPPKDHALRLVYSAGAKLAPSISQAFYECWNTPVGQIYGSSEIGSVFYSNPKSSSFDAASVGLALENVTVRILSHLDDKHTVLHSNTLGAVAIQSASMLTRYFSQDDLILNQGHLLTGDLGYLDDNGRLYLKGRASTMLDVGGKKVNPEEVEEVLKLHPQVKDCIVSSVHVSDSVSRLRATIVPQEQESQPQANDLRVLVRSHLQPYKVPRSFVFASDIPKSALGKVIRNDSP